MKAIYKREMRSYFTSPIGYVFIGIFMLLTGFFMFRPMMFVEKRGDINNILPDCLTILILLLPLITMRLFSEERANKTDQLLLTAPVKVSEIVLGKYFAALTVFLLAVMTTLPYFIIAICYSTTPLGEVLVAYLGYILMGSLFVAIGLAISTLTESQVLSAVLTYGITIFLFFTSRVHISVPLIGEIWRYLQVDMWCVSFYRGIITPAELVYYLSFTSLVLILAARKIESRRWR